MRSTSLCPKRQPLQLGMATHFVARELSALGHDDFAATFNRNDGGAFSAPLSLKLQIRPPATVEAN